MAKATVSVTHTPPCFVSHIEISQTIVCTSELLFSTKITQVHIDYISITFGQNLPYDVGSGIGVCVCVCVCFCASVLMRVAVVDDDDDWNCSFFD